MLVDCIGERTVNDFADVESVTRATVKIIDELVEQNFHLTSIIAQYYIVKVEVCKYILEHPTTPGV